MKHLYLKIIAIILLCLRLSGLNAQTITCSELYEFIIENGYKAESIPDIVMKSSWLKTVTKYTYDNTIFVVAEIKTDEWGIATKSYIFCGIPSENWYLFYIPTYGESYGEKFHKYIIDYSCNCE
jgi:hypothetical protein